MCMSHVCVVLGVVEGRGGGLDRVHVMYVEVSSHVTCVQEEKNPVFLGEVKSGIWYVNTPDICKLFLSWVEVEGGRERLRCGAVGRGGGGVWWVISIPPHHPQVLRK